MQYQVRTYKLLPGKADDFVRVWRDELVPLRRKFGWDVVGGWLTEDGDGFVWVVGHDDFEAEEKRYYDSPERAALTNPAQFLDSTQTKITLAQRIL